MAVDFDKTIVLANSIPDNILTLFILKSIELGTLKFESATTTLGIYGISLQIKRDLPKNTSNNSSINNNNDNNSGINNEIIDTGSTSTMSSTTPYFEIHSIDNSNDSNINNNNSNNFKYGEFSSRGNQIWSANYAEEKESYLDGSTNELKEKYKEFIGNNQLKCLPKEISDFRRAKEHFQNIFMPKLVCSYFFFPLSVISSYLSSFLIYSDFCLPFQIFIS